MYAVLVIDVDAVIYVPQYEDHAFRILVVCRHNSMQAFRLLIKIVMCLDILQKIQPELIQAKIHDGYAGGHILNIYNLFLQPLQLLFTIFEVALFFWIDQIVITGRSHDGYLHSGFDTRLQVDIIIQRHIRPEVYQLDKLVSAANTVDTTKALDDAYRIPVNVVVHQIVAVLQVLAF